eukprot:7585890-Lingulodinium_polyedra.AAC.1
MPSTSGAARAAPVEPRGSSSVRPLRGSCTKCWCPSWWSATLHGHCCRKVNKAFSPTCARSRGTCQAA